MKKILKLLMIVVIVFGLIGCRGKENEVPNNTNTAENNNDNGDKNNQHLLSYSIVDLFLSPSLNFSKQRNMKLAFFEEREDIKEIITTSNYQEIVNDSYPVEYDECYDEDNNKYYPRFHKTAKKTEFYYHGNFNEENYPEGLGVIIEYKTNNESGYTLSASVPVIKYIGYFKNGSYYGYGVKFEANLLDLDLRTEEGIEFFYNNIQYLSTAQYIESYYFKGLPVEKKNEVYSTLKFACNLSEFEVNNGYFNAESIKYSAVVNIADEENNVWEHYEYTLGYPEFEGYLDSNGKITGYSKIYSTWPNVNLVYEGNFVDGKLNGFGKKYSELTGNLIYEGEFENGLYSGKGKLYDEEGRLIHEGDFNNGEIY